MAFRRIIVVIALVLVAGACSGDEPLLTAELDPGATVVPEPINPRVCNGVASLAEQLAVLDASDTQRVEAAAQRSSVTAGTAPDNAPAEVAAMLNQIGVALTSADTEVAQVGAEAAITAERGIAGTYLDTTCTDYRVGSLTNGLDAIATTSSQTRAAAIAEAKAAADTEDDDSAEVDSTDSDGDDSDGGDSDGADSDGADSEGADAAAAETPEGAQDISFAPGSNEYEGVEFVVTRILRTVADPATVLAGAEVDGTTASGNWITVGVSFTSGSEAARGFEAGNVLLIDPSGNVVTATELLGDDGSAAGGFSVSPGETVRRVAVFAVPAEVTNLDGWSVGMGRSGQVPAVRSLEVSNIFQYPYVLDSGGASGTILHADEDCRASSGAPTLTASIVQVIVSPEPWFSSGDRSALGTRNVSVVANVAPLVVPAAEGPCAEIDLEVTNYPLTLLVDGVEVQSELDDFGLAAFPRESTLVTSPFVIPYNTSRLSLVSADGSIIDEWVLSLAPEVGE